MGETTVGHVAGEVVRALYGAGYMESTIGQYRKSIRALERYAGGPDAVYTRGLGAGCVCSIESGPCERVDVFHVSGRFWSTSACGEKRTPARPAWTSFPS